MITDFDAVHSPVDSDTNQYLILGNLPISKPAADLPPELAVFLGRWEGYSYAPPVKKDRKVVLVIQELTVQRGKAVGWSGTNLQYPDRVGEIHFRVVAGAAPSIEFQAILPDGSSVFADERLRVGQGGGGSWPAPQQRNDIALDQLGSVGRCIPPVHHPVVIDQELGDHATRAAVGAEPS